MTGQCFSIWALCFEAEWRSIATSARVELLCVDGALSRRSSEEGTSQEIRAATSRSSLRLSGGFGCISTVTVVVFFFPPPFCLFYSQARSRFASAQQFSDGLWTQKVLSDGLWWASAKLLHSNASRGQTEIPFVLQKKPSPAVLAVPLARHDEIHSTDRADDKWQGEESVNEKRCVWKWGLCSYVRLFFPSVLWKRKQSNLWRRILFSFNRVQREETCMQKVLCFFMHFF